LKERFGFMGSGVGTLGVGIGVSFFSSASSGGGEIVLPLPAGFLVGSGALACCAKAGFYMFFNYYC
jgi:hypothetical protein